MRSFRYFQTGDKPAAVDTDAAAISSRAPASSCKTNPCSGENLSFLAPATELEKIRKLTIGEAILMFVTPERGFQ
jgi:hypothetical protein